MYLLIAERASTISIHYLPRKISVAKAISRLPKNLNLEKILNLTPILPSPKRHLMTQIRQLMPNNRRATEENTHPPLPLPIPLKQFAHLFVMLAEDLCEVGSAEVRGCDQTRQGGVRVLGRAVLFEQEAVDVRGDVFAFLGDVVVQADVQVGVVCAGGDFVEEGGKPFKVDSVPDYPVEVHAAVEV